jgi:hypothetical protein
LELGRQAILRSLLHCPTPEQRYAETTLARVSSAGRSG